MLLRGRSCTTRNSSGLSLNISGNYAILRWNIHKRDLPSMNESMYVVPVVRRGRGWYNATLRTKIDLLFSPLLTSADFSFPHHPNSTPLSTPLSGNVNFKCMYDITMLSCQNVFRCNLAVRQRLCFQLYHQTTTMANLVQNVLNFFRNGYNIIPSGQGQGWTQDQWYHA